MKDRGALYVGILMIVFGGFFLLAQMTNDLPFGIRLGWEALWPGLILLIGLAFWLPIFVWWPRHEQLAGFAVPATIITVNGLILAYQNMTGNWESWAYIWALEPVSVALGLLMLYLLGGRAKGLLVAAAIVGGIGLVFFFIFASAFGGWVGFLGPIVLILIGAYVIMNGLRQHRKTPQE